MPYTKQTVDDFVHSQGEHAGRVLLVDLYVGCLGYGLWKIVCIVLGLQQLDEMNKIESMK